MNTETTHKGYDSLTDEQLVELTRIALGSDYYFKVDRTSTIRVSFSGWVCVLVPDCGNIQLRVHGTAVQINDLFGFFHKCREFGLPY